MYGTRPEYETVRDNSYKTSKQELLKNHVINIEFLSIGCVVKVGCASVPFESVDKAMMELNAYVNNPEESMTKWRKLLG